jgi:polar amino acid transport system permease protein
MNGPSTSPGGTGPAGPLVLTTSHRGLGRRQRQRLSLGIQYALFLLLLAVVAVAADWQRLGDAFARLDVARSMFPDVITIALRNTLIYTLLAFAFGLVVGLLLALMRLSSIAPYRWFARTYIELFRGLPALLVLFMVGYGIPVAFQDYVFVGGIYGQVAVGLGLMAAAYMAETIRAGIQAVPRGQLEAARTLGMSYPRAMISIVLPQAFRIIIPPMTNEIILLTKDSSLAYVLGVTFTTVELTKFGRDTLNVEANPTPLIVVGLMYLVITLPLSQLVRWLEVRAAKGRR